MSGDKVLEGYLDSERKDDFKTLSGFELAASYASEGAERPGEYPFSRGIRVNVTCHEPGVLPRYEGKAERVQVRAPE